MKRPASPDDVPNALAAIAFLLACHLAVEIGTALWNFCRP